MKQKVALALSFLLALCLLFSSCAAAGIRPALIGELEKNARKTGQALYGLLSDHSVICENGAARYTLVADSAADDNITAGVYALCTAIAEVTGVTLPVAQTRPEGGKAILAELVSSPTKAREYGLNNSLFRIFFADGDLHIAATNKMMLAEGLRQFTARFVIGENAAAGTGYFGIPADTNLFADTGAVFDADGKSTYTILFPEDASAQVKDAAVSLTAAIREKTGGNVRVKSDFAASADTEHIIVVGNCNRQGIAQATEKLDQVTYRIEADGKDIFLLGGSDEMVAAAVNAFSEAFISGALSAPKSGFAFPLSLTFEHTLKTVVVAAGGKTDYVLVYPGGASEAVRNAALQFSDLFYTITGAVLPVLPDTGLPAATEYEIRLGQTNRAADGEETEEKSWYIRTDNTILIGGGSDKALLTALKRFSSICIDLVLTQNETEDLPQYSARLLYFIYGTVYHGTVK